MITLDTNVLIELEKGDKKLISTLKELKHGHPQPSLPFPVFSEYYYGYLKKGRKKIVAALERLEEFEVLNSTKRSAMLFSEIKYRLEKAGNIIPEMDILIAAISIDNGAILLTYDKQFKSIENLNAIILEE